MDVLKILVCIFIALFLVSLSYVSLYIYIYVGLDCKINFIDTLKKTKEFLTMVSNIRKLYKKEGKVIIFPLIFGNTPGLINMATSFPKAPVIYKPVWGYHYAQNPEVFSIAFMHSVGHEIGHWTDIKKGRDFSKRTKEEKEFFCWVREIRNDFEGINILERHCPNIRRSQIINAIECKANAQVINLKSKKKKCKQNRRKNSYHDHPDWDFRLQVIKCGQFNQDVIRKIADKSGCTNTDFVLKVIRMYFCK